MDSYSNRKSNKPIAITTVVLTVAFIFVLYNVFLKGPEVEVEHVQKVCGHGR